MKIDNHVIKNYLNDKNKNYKSIEHYNENDHIRNYLNYWIKYDITKFEIDLQWGKEAYFNTKDNESFDTILSFWYPLEIYIRYIDEKKEKKYYYKNNRVIKNNKIEIRDDLDFYLKPSNFDEEKVYNKLQILAELSSSRANVMKIPKYRYNTKESFNKFHYSVSKDQIWVFLNKLKNDKKCISFANNDELNKWINEEKLDIMSFKNNIDIDFIDKNFNTKSFEDYKNIILDPSIDSNEFFKKYNELLDMYIYFITARQEELRN